MHQLVSTLTLLQGVSVFPVALVSNSFKTAAVLLRNDEDIRQAMQILPVSAALSGSI